MPRPFQKDGRPGAATDLRKYRRVFLEWSVSTGRAHSNVLAGLRNPKRSRAPNGSQPRPTAAAP